MIHFPLIGFDYHKMPSLQAIGPILNTGKTTIVNSDTLEEGTEIAEGFTSLGKYFYQNFIEPLGLDLLVTESPKEIFASTLKVGIKSLVDPVETASKLMKAGSYFSYLLDIADDLDTKKQLRTMQSMLTDISNSLLNFEENINHNEQTVQEVNLKLKDFISQLQSLEVKIDETKIDPEALATNLLTKIQNELKEANESKLNEALQKEQIQVTQAGINFVSHLIALKDPKLANQVNVVAHSSLTVWHATKKLLNLGGSLLSFAALGNFIAIGESLLAVYNTFNQEPSELMIISNQLNQIHDTLSLLRNELHSLHGMHITLLKRFIKLDFKIDKLTEIFKIELGFVEQELQSIFVEVSTTGPKIAEYTVDWLVTHAEIVKNQHPNEESFKEFQGKLLAASYLTTHELFTGLASNTKFSLSAGEIVKKLHGKQAESNINYLSTLYSSETHLPLPNSIVWTKVADTFVEFTKPYPNYTSSIIKTDFVEKMFNLGNRLQKFIHHLQRDDAFFVQLINDYKITIAQLAKLPSAEIIAQLGASDTTYATLSVNYLKIVNFCQIAFTQSVQSDAMMKLFMNNQANTQSSFFALLDADKIKTILKKSPDITRDLVKEELFFNLLNSIELFHDIIVAKIAALKEGSAYEGNPFVDFVLAKLESYGQTIYHDPTITSFRNTSAFYLSTEQVPLLPHYLTLEDIQKENFFFVIKANNIPQAKILLQTNPNLVYCVDSLLRTPLHYAAEIGSADLCSLLLNNGANIDQLDVHGFAPIHFLARSNNNELVATFFNFNVDLSIYPHPFDLNHNPQFSYLINQRKNAITTAVTDLSTRKIFALSSDKFVTTEASSYTGSYLSYSTNEKVFLITNAALNQGYRVEYKNSTMRISRVAEQEQHLLSVPFHLNERDSKALFSWHVELINHYLVIYINKGIFDTANRYEYRSELKLCDLSNGKIVWELPVIENYMIESIQIAPAILSVFMKRYRQDNRIENYHLIKGHKLNSLPIASTYSHSWLITQNWLVTGNQQGQITLNDLSSKTELSLQPELADIKSFVSQQATDCKKEKILTYTCPSLERLGCGFVFNFINDNILVSAIDTYQRPGEYSHTDIWNIHQSKPLLSLPGKTQLLTNVRVQNRFISHCLLSVAKAKTNFEVALWEVTAEGQVNKLNTPHTLSFAHRHINFYKASDDILLALDVQKRTLVIWGIGEIAFIQKIPNVITLNSLRLQEGKIFCQMINRDQDIKNAVIQFDLPQPELSYAIVYDQDTYPVDWNKIDSEMSEGDTHLLKQGYGAMGMIMNPVAQSGPAQTSSLALISSYLLADTLTHFPQKQKDIDQLEASCAYIKMLADTVPPELTATKITQGMDALAPYLQFAAVFEYISAEQAKKLPYDAGYWQIKIHASGVLIYTFFGLKEGKDVGYAEFYGKPGLCRSADGLQHNLLKATGAFGYIETETSLSTEEICEYLPPTKVEQFISGFAMGAYHSMLCKVAENIDAEINEWHRKLFNSTENREVEPEESEQEKSFSPQNRSTKITYSPTYYALWYLTEYYLAHQKYTFALAQLGQNDPEMSAQLAENEALWSIIFLLGANLTINGLSSAAQWVGEKAKTQGWPTTSKICSQAGKVVPWLTFFAKSTTVEGMISTAANVAGGVTTTLGIDYMCSKMFGKK